jgi:hypothetical protein
VKVAYSSYLILVLHLFGVLRTKIPIFIIPGSKNNIPESKCWQSVVSRDWDSGSGRQVRSEGNFSSLVSDLKRSKRVERSSESARLLSTCT